MEANDIYFSCPNCGHKLTEQQWSQEAIYEYDGMISSIQANQLADFDITSRGDHAKCPKCNNLLNINNDLIEN